MKRSIQSILIGSAILASSPLLAQNFDYQAYRDKWKPVTCDVYHNIPMWTQEAEVMDKLNEVYPPSQFITEYEKPEPGNPNAKKVTIKDKDHQESFMFIAGFDSDKKLNFKNIGYYCAE